MTLNVKLKGKKRGMMQVFDDHGHVVACTVIHVEPNVVTQVKSVETDGYNAVQLAHEEIVAKDKRRCEERASKPRRGHFAKAGVAPRRRLAETRVEAVSEFSLGQEIGVGALAEVAFVDVTSISKGKGFQGVMKKYNFAGGPAAHGSGFHRAHGSTGMRSTPGRVLPNGKIASQMGGKQVTTQNLQVMKVIEEDGVILVRGNVPGPNGAVVTLQQAKKRTKK